MFETLLVPLGLLLAILLLLGGLPIGFAIGIGGIITLVLSDGIGGLNALGFIMWGSLNSATLSALPLFILMAEFMLRSGVSETYYDGMSKLIRRVPGGLLQTNIASCALFAAISGSSVATASAIGSVALPRQKSDGYDMAMATGSIAAGGTLGILIPPSVVMIVYSTFAELSVAKLFMAGLVPGLVLTGLFMGYIALRSFLRPSLAPRSERVGPGGLLRGLKEISPMVLLMVAILGSIYRGIATPTEAAAIGAVLAGILSWVTQRPPLRAYVDATLNAIVASAVILLITAGAFILNYAVESSGITHAITEWVVGLDLNVNMFLLALVIMFAIMGCLIEAIGLVVLTVPILLPILQSYGIDLIWFGVLLVIVVELSLITPPVGINLFVVESLVKTGIATVIRGIVPYYIIYLILILLLVVWPPLATWMPSLM